MLVLFSILMHDIDILLRFDCHLFEAGLMFLCLVNVFFRFKMIDTQHNQKNKRNKYGKSGSLICKRCLGIKPWPRVNKQYIHLKTHKHHITSNILQKNDACIFVFCFLFFVRARMGGIGIGIDGLMSNNVCLFTNLFWNINYTHFVFCLFVCNWFYTYTQNQSNNGKIKQVITNYRQWNDWLYA